MNEYAAIIFIAITVRLTYLVTVERATDPYGWDPEPITEGDAFSACKLLIVQQLLIAALSVKAIIEWVF